MILEQLMEKKDLHMYIKLRRLMLARELKKFNKKLRREDISNKEKKRIMKSISQLHGRIKEMNTLMTVLHEGNDGIKKKSKLYWVILEMQGGNKI